ncbi:MAG: T9SS type A sorting domain-containing protein [Saprospiraceae bacterium]
MRTSFTQIFNLKNTFLMLLLAGSSVAIGQCDDPIPAPEGAVYNHQFDAGIDGWTSTDLDGNPSTNWVWQADGLVAGGAFNAVDGNNDFILSPSVCNGAMVFDSDFLDNDGFVDLTTTPISGFGDGACPVNNDDGSFISFCDAILSSPVIDLSGATTELAIQFNQGVRQFNSEYYLLLSKDGGLSYYDTIQLNTDLPTNSAHILQDVQTIPLCGASGSAEFVMAFWLRGNYYYWGLDDISLIPSNIPDARTNENFFAVSPQYGTPYNMTFDIPFLADIENVSAATAVAPELTVSVTDASGSVLHTETRTYDDVPGCNTDENKPFMQLFTPGNDMSAMGKYGVSYTLETTDDINAENDSQSGEFEITEFEFKKVISEEENGGEYLNAIRYAGGAFQSWGSYFYIPQNDKGQHISEIRSGIVPANGQQFGAGQITVAVYQWVDVNEDGDVNSGDVDEKIKLGEAVYFVTAANTDARDFKVTPLTPSGDFIVPEAGAEIIVMLHHEPFSGEINYFGLNSDAPENRSFYYAATQQAYTQLGLPQRYSSFGGVGSVAADADTGRDFFPETRWTNFINMRLSDITGTEDINTDLGIEVYPSPASTVVNVDMDLEETSAQVSIQLVDIKGQIASTNVYTNIKNDKLSIDVSNLVGGMYIMTIRTEAGMMTKQISVIH